MSTPVSIKVELRRRAGESTFHRFSGTYNYSELSSVISHLWGEQPKHLVLQYTDDEGDQVLLTSDSEWEECLRVFRKSNSALLRLTAFCSAKESKEQEIKREEKKEREERATNKNSQKHADPCAQFFADLLGQGQQQQKRSSCQRPSYGHPFAQMFGAGCCPRRQQQRKEPQPQHQQQFNSQNPWASLFETFASAAQECNNTKKQEERKEQQRSEEKEQQEHPFAFLESLFGGCENQKQQHNSKKWKHDLSSATLDLLSLVYGRNARQELESGDVSSTLRRGLQRCFSPFTGLMRIGVDNSVLFADAVARGNSLIESHDLGEAEHLLGLALEVFNDHPILQYNQACVMSLQGRLEEAVDLLLLAKSNGYNDGEKLETDPDLENVRDHPRFAELIGSLFGSKAARQEQQDAPQPRSTPASPVSPVAGGNAPTPVHTPVNDDVPTIDEVENASTASHKSNRVDPDEEFVTVLKEVETEEEKPVSVQKKTEAELVEAAAAAEASKPKTTPAPSKPVLSDEVVALLDMFPDMSVDEAKHALARSSGDVARAVNGRLAGYW